MTIRRFTIALAAALAFAAAGIAWPTAAGDPAFSHTLHLEQDDSLACGDCHALAETGVTIKRDKCEECHDEEIPAFASARAWPPLRATFPHTLHAESLDCSDCHAPAEGEAPPLPKVSKASHCFVCHADQGIEVSPSDCATCHAGVGDLPPERTTALGYILPHALHAESFACSDCHAGGQRASARHGALIPGPSHCFACHEENGVEALPPNCASCHGTEVTGPPPSAGAVVRMPHLPHARTGACASCHSAAVAADGKHGAAKPIPRAECFNCHRERGAEISVDACATCHGASRRLKAPPSHARQWRRQHGLVAQFQGLAVHGESCDLCHRQDGCNGCHRREAPRSHNGLWRLRSHGTAAAWDREACKTCHETGQCIRCHRETEPLNHRGAWGVVHGLAAASEGNERCRACHDSGFCLDCHRRRQ